jgi:hypothetical protein
MHQIGSGRQGHDMMRAGQKDASARALEAMQELGLNLERSITDPRDFTKKLPGIHGLDQSVDIIPRCLEALFSWNHVQDAQRIQRVPRAEHQEPVEQSALARASRDRCRTPAA